MQSCNSARHVYVDARRGFCCALAFSALLLSGCAAISLHSTHAYGGPETLIDQAESALEKGRQEHAIALLNQAARENPTSTAPWLRIANIWFDEGNYASTILAANEVLARDPGNHEAKSLLVVSGLRVAASAVHGLVPRGPVNPGARQEAENLTKSLRLALGEPVLVPADEQKRTAPRSRRRIAPSLHLAGTGANVPATPAAAISGRQTMPVLPHASTVVQAAQGSLPPSPSADPFKALK